jgi:8-oxo-dGTP diphosphatase
MSSHRDWAPIVVGVGAVVWNDQAQILLVRRANPPRQHEWSLPGGKLESGETLRAALIREVREETSLEVETEELIDVVELSEQSRTSQAYYVLIDFTARVVSGNPVAGSDALETRWFSLKEIEMTPLWSETRRVIALSAARKSRTGSSAS